jgi:DNA-directed RNA polymerase, mitochondrial
MDFKKDKRGEMDDLTESVNRQYESDVARAKYFGLGLSKRGLGLADRYVPELMARIRAERKFDRGVPKTIRRLDDETIARTLLEAGITVCADNDFGTDAGDRNFTNIALWIGRNFPCKESTELELDVGSWGMCLLEMLPIFWRDPDDHVLMMTPEADEIMEGVLTELTKDNPLLRPMTEPPVPWTQVDRGGLPSDYWPRVRLVRHRATERVWREEIKQGRMERPLAALNYLQSPAWIINEPVLEFMRRRGFQLPQHRRSDFDGDKKWNRAIGEWRVLAYAWWKDMVTAESLAQGSPFYIPLKLEFRGRIVPIPRFHYQREDHVRGLFLFADGELIGGQYIKGQANRAQLWLRAHVAAKADGIDWGGVEKPSKLRPIDQFVWTAKNQDKLLAIGEHVLNRGSPETLPFALPADEPCQFLAACVELYRAEKVGPNFITRLPIMLDASNSALQHMAASVLAEEGEYANLSDNKEPNDFYVHVAEAVWDTGEDCTKIMKGRDDRSLIKKACVPNSYGSKSGSWRIQWKRDDGKWKKGFKAVGMAGAIVKELKDRGQRAGKDAVKLAKLIEMKIKELAPNIARVAQFHRDSAGCYAAHNKHYGWTTPFMGLKVISCYLKPIEVRRRVPIKNDENGKRKYRRPRVRVGYADDVKSQKARNAAPANFTHSMDACHLQMTALKCAVENLPLMSIHDCYAATATRVARMLDIARERFHFIYKNHDVLADVLAVAKQDLPEEIRVQLPNAKERVIKIKFPVVPPKGRLDLDKALVSHNMIKG